MMVSHNLHRRHLTVGQKAQVALRLKELLEPEAKERKREGGKSAGNGRPKKDVANLPQAKSRDKAAAMLGISGKPEVENLPHREKNSKNVGEKIATNQKNHLTLTQRPHPAMMGALKPTTGLLVSPRLRWPKPLLE